jgi:hypothetical protein
MKHLKKFESFEENIPVAKFQLEEDQVDDLHEQFERFIEDWETQNKEQLSPKEMQDIFAEDEKGELSDEFVKFLHYLEDNTSWFSFNLMDKVRNDLSIIVAKSDINYEEEEDDFDFAQDDPEWPHEAQEEEESGEFADPDMGEDDDIEQLRQKTYSKKQKFNMDDILDKIGASGYDSLSYEEREFLSKQEGRKILGFGRFNK